MKFLGWGVVVAALFAVVQANKLSDAIVDKLDQTSKDSLLKVLLGKFIYNVWRPANLNLGPGKAAVLIGQDMACHNRDCRYSLGARKCPREWTYTQDWVKDKKTLSQFLTSDCQAVDDNASLKEEEAANKPFDQLKVDGITNLGALIVSGLQNGQTYYFYTRVRLSATAPWVDDMGGAVSFPCCNDDPLAKVLHIKASDVMNISRPPRGR